MTVANRRTVEVLADRAVPILVQMAKAGRTIEYGQLAALITRRGEPPVPNQLIGKVCETIIIDVADKSVHETRPEFAYLTAFVVRRDTQEVSDGWAPAFTRHFGPGIDLPGDTYTGAPAAARRLAQEYLSENTDA